MNAARLAAIGLLLWGTAARADPAFGPSVTTKQGATTVANTKTLKFTSGCTLTANGTEADIACTGGMSSVVADPPLSGAGTSGSHLALDYGTGLTTALNVLVVDQAASLTWTGTETFNTNPVRINVGIQPTAQTVSAGSDIYLYAGDSSAAGANGGTVYVRGGNGNGGSGGSDVVVGCQAGATAGSCGVDVCHDGTCTAFWLGHGSIGLGAGSQANSGRLFPWGLWSIPLMFDPSAGTNTEQPELPTGPTVTVGSNGAHISGTPLVLRGGYAGDADAGANGGAGGRLDMSGAVGGLGNGAHTPGNGGDTRLYAGNAGGAGAGAGSANGGSVDIQVGDKTNGGITGAVHIGDSASIVPSYIIAGNVATPTSIFLGLEEGASVATSANNYVITNERNVVMTTGPALRAIFLPNPSTCLGNASVGAGGSRRVTIECVDCNGSTGILYVYVNTGAGSRTIDDQNTAVGNGVEIDSAYTSTTYSCNGTQWYTDSVRLTYGAAGTFWRSQGPKFSPVMSTLTLPNAATTGDVLIATGTNAIGSLAAVATGSYLRSAGTSTAPVYSTLTLPNAATQGDLMVASGANAMGVLSDVAVGKVLISGGTSTAPSWGPPNLCTKITWAAGAGAGQYALGTGAGTGGVPSATIAGGDCGGIISVTTGTTPANGAVIITLKFGVAYANAPSVTITPANQAAANFQYAAGNVYVGSTSTTAFALQVYNTLGGTNTYIWNYTVSGWVP